MKDLGRLGEEMVLEKYLKDGYKLLDRNYIFPRGKQTGELDLVLSKDEEIVFVEVKLRTNNRFGTGFEAVDWYKQRKLIRTAKLYMQMHSKFENYKYRIDVAAVDIDNSDNPVIILTNAIEDSD